MPSKYMVSVSLDNETVELWESLPVGERSKRLREALKQASIVNERDMLVEALRKQIKSKNKALQMMELEIANLQAFGVKE